MFKVGDKVKNISITTEGLKYGEIYTIRKIDTQYSPGYKMLFLEEDKNETIGYWDYRFKPYKYRKEKLERVLRCSK